MAQTTSTGAKKIQDSDNWRDIFADHNDTVDAYDGVITGTVSVITGTTNNTGHTIAAGEYFIANGSKYKATASIPSNTAWASSATAVSDIDIINSLNSAIKTVSTNLGSASSASSVTGADAFSKIDALNSNITKFDTQNFSSYSTESALKSAIVSYIANMSDYEIRHLRFVMSADSGEFRNTYYVATLTRFSSTRVHCRFIRCNDAVADLIMVYNNGTWITVS